MAKRIIIRGDRKYEYNPKTGTIRNYWGGESYDEVLADRPYGILDFFNQRFWDVKWIRWSFTIMFLLLIAGMLAVGLVPEPLDVKQQRLTDCCKENGFSDEGSGVPNGSSCTFVRDNEDRGSKEWACYKYTGDGAIFGIGTVLAGGLLFLLIGTWSGWAIRQNEMNEVLEDIKKEESHLRMMLTDDEREARKLYEKNHLDFYGIDRETMRNMREVK